MRNWFLGMVVSLAMSGVACSRDKKPDQLAALEEAYRSGVVTKAEYDAKRAALSGPTQLAALDDAYQSGVLTKAEYEAKRAALLGPAPISAPAPSGAPAPVAAVAPVRVAASQPPAASPQMSALEDAYKAGMLTKEEYEAKRAGAAPAPAPQATFAADRPQNAAGAAPAQNAAGAAPQQAAAAVPQQAAAAAPQAAAAAPQQAAAAAPAPRGNFLVLKKVALMDQTGFERPLPVATMLVPSEWQAQGGTQWNAKDSCNPIRIQFRASGPDGRGIEVFPPFSWAWADDPSMLRLSAQQSAQYGTHACDVMPPMGAADYLRRNIGRVRPNAQIVSIEPLPKLMQVLQQQARQTEQAAAQYRLQQRVRPDTIRARLRYNLNGQAVEEWVIVTTMTTGTAGPSMNMSGQMGQSFNYSCSASWIGERAPQGQLDSSEKLFEMLLATIRGNPEWVARVTKNNAAIFRAEQAEVGKRSEITRKLGEDMGDIRRQVAANQARSDDHVFGQFSQATLGLETYRNPISGETFDLSNNYGRAWVNNRNEIVLSDQDGFDPNVALKGEWTAMQRVPR